MESTLGQRKREELSRFRGKCSGSIGRESFGAKTPAFLCAVLASGLVSLCLPGEKRDPFVDVGQSHRAANAVEVQGGLETLQRA